MNQYSSIAVYSLLKGQEIYIHTSASHTYREGVITLTGVLLTNYSNVRPCVAKNPPCREKLQPSSLCSPHWHYLQSHYSQLCLHLRTFLYSDTHLRSFPALWFPCSRPPLGANLLFVLPSYRQPSYKCSSSNPNQRARY